MDGCDIRGVFFSEDPRRANCGSNDELSKRNKSKPRSAIIGGRKRGRVAAVIVTELGIVVKRKRRVERKSGRREPFGYKTGR